MTKEKIGSVLERLDRLGLGKNDEDVTDEQESARRDVLFASVISAPSYLILR